MSTKLEKLDEALADFIIHACKGEVAPFMAGAVQVIANLLTERTILRQIEAKVSACVKQADNEADEEPPPPT